MQSSEALVATGISGTSDHHAENGSVRMVQSVVMIRVGRRQNWCVIGIGVSFGENSTLAACGASMSMQANGHQNALPEKMLCDAHCDFQRAVEVAAGALNKDELVALAQGVHGCHQRWHISVAC